MLIITYRIFILVNQYCFLYVKWNFIGKNHMSKDNSTSKYFLTVIICVLFNPHLTSVVKDCV